MPKSNAERTSKIRILTLNTRKIVQKSLQRSSYNDSHIFIYLGDLIWEIECFDFSRMTHDNQIISCLEIHKSQWRSLWSARWTLMQCKSKKAVCPMQDLSQQAASTWSCRDPLSSNCQKKLHRFQTTSLLSIPATPTQHYRGLRALQWRGFGSSPAIH